MRLPFNNCENIFAEPRWSVGETHLDSARKEFGAHCNFCRHVKEKAANLIFNNCPSGGIIVSEPHCCHSDGSLS